jgi:hypothetical protein
MARMTMIDEQKRAVVGQSSIGLRNLVGAALGLPPTHAEPVRVGEFAAIEEANARSKRLNAALCALVEFGQDRDFEEAAKLIAKVAAKAMRRKS